MAGWFSRATKGERADAEPVEFVLTCQCGGPITGTRGARMQVAVCPTCAAQLCVLPASPYPRPKLRTPKPKQKPVTPTRPLLLDEDDEEVVRTPPPIPTRGGRQAKPSSKPVTQKSTRKDPRKSEPVSAEPQWSAPCRKIITPLRLIAVGMIAVVSVAGWWVSHRRAVARAVVTFAESSKSARTALSRSEFDTADQLLTRAVSALDLLGRDDREARQVRQLAREVAAVQGLDLTSLFELIGEARHMRDMQGADWQLHLRRSHQGRWFLLETNGLQFSGGDPPQWSFTLPVLPGADPVRIRGDLSQWSNVWGSTAPTHVIFAGQLEDVRPFQDATTKGWEIVLKPDSLFLWTDAELYNALGGTFDETAVATLKSQAQVMGITE